MGEINFFPDDLEIKDQKIILRLDLNVPIKDKVIKDDTRITLCLPFINRLIEKKAKIIIISHLGRPKGINVPDLSLIPIYKYLKDALKTNVYFFRGTFDGETKEKFSHLKGGEVILIENIRFFKGEIDNDENFSKKLASLGDIYINDAFGTAHRNHASTGILPSFFKGKKAMGFLLSKELEVIDKVFKNDDLNEIKIQFFSDFSQLQYVSVASFDRVTQSNDDEQQEEGTWKEGIMFKGPSAVQLNERLEAKNLLGIYSSLNNSTLQNTVENFSGKNFSEFKENLAQVLVDKLQPISKEIKKLPERCNLWG